jgi:hypothetical protein
MLIENRLIDDGGWITRNAVRCFNLYRPPELGADDGAWLCRLPCTLASAALFQPALMGPPRHDKASVG